MIANNCKAILDYIFANESSVEELIGELHNPHLVTQLSTTCFLLEVCNSSKQLQTEAKCTFFSSLLDAQLLQLLTQFCSLPPYFAFVTNSYRISGTKFSEDEFKEECKRSNTANVNLVMNGYNILS